MAGIKQATVVIETAKPDKIITIGGNFIVSQAPFDYLHGIYDSLGIIWSDAHPDVSTAKDGYPNAHTTWHLARLWVMETARFLV